MKSNPAHVVVCLGLLLSSCVIPTEDYSKSVTNGLFQWAFDGERVIYEPSDRSSDKPGELRIALFGSSDDGHSPDEIGAVGAFTVTTFSLAPALAMDLVQLLFLPLRGSGD